MAAASSPVVTNFAAAPIGISPTGSVVLGDRGAALMASHRSSSTTTTPHTASGTEYDPQATQTFLLGEAPNNWNPHAAVNADPEIASPLATILGPVLPSVFTVKPGYGVALNTTFMSSARQVGNDPQTIRYRINPEATWSDGTPITYQDFVYAWQSQARGSGASSASAITSGYRQIASVSEVGGDPYVVSVVFSTPDYDWRSLFSFLLPAHVAETVGFTDPTAVVSGGPFEVQSSVPGVSVTLVRNPRWWGSPPTWPR